MKSTGIVRRLDELGRITLPIELRRNFDVNERDPLEIFVDDDKIILKKYNPADIFTGEDMVGKKVMVLVNLKPAKLAGVLSEGMLLCAENDKGELALVTPDKDMPAGAEIC